MELVYEKIVWYAVLYRSLFWASSLNSKEISLDISNSYLDFELALLYHTLLRH